MLAKVRKKASEDREPSGDTSKKDSIWAASLEVIQRRRESRTQSSQPAGSPFAMNWKAAKGLPNSPVRRARRDFKDRQRTA